jgi:hypothetical protein
MAQALEREADGVDQVDAGAHQGVAQLQPQQILLGLGGAVFNGMEQRSIRAGQPGEHLGVAPVALALIAGDGVEFARVGHQHGGTEAGEITADPRTVRARFQRDGGCGELGEQLGQGGPRVGQRSLTNNLTSGIQRANVMGPITEIKAEGEPADDSRRGSRNEERSVFCFHRQTLSPTRHCVSGLPSHLILLGHIWCKW